MNRVFPIEVYRDIYGSLSYRPDTKMTSKLWGHIHINLYWGIADGMYYDSNVEVDDD